MATLQSSSTQTPPEPSSKQSPTYNPYTNSPRLGMPFDRRLLLTTALAFTSGFTLGSMTAGRAASLRFRAENAHRLPVSNPGWYLYQKSKNYYKWKFGIVEGLKKGVYIAAWSTVFFIVEESLDVFRGTWRAGRTMSEMEGVDELDMRRIEGGIYRCRDAVSSAMAGMVTGGLWSVTHGFPVTMAARTIRMGLMVGLGYGLGQDGLAWLKEKYGGGEQGEGWIYKGAKNRVMEEDVKESLSKEG